MNESDRGARPASSADGSKGARRRARIIGIAAHVIATEGVDALTAARVAELAECARSLVYRYFPTIEDLRWAVVETTYEDLDRHLPLDVIAQRIKALSAMDDGPASGGVGRDGAIDRPWAWSVVTDAAGADTNPYLGQATLALIRASAVSDIFGDHERQFAEQMELRWVAHLREVGLGRQEIEIITDCLFAALHRAMHWFNAGELDQAKLEELVAATLSSLIRTFTMQLATPARGRRRVTSAASGRRR